MLSRLLVTTALGVTLAPDLAVAQTPPQMMLPPVPRAVPPPPHPAMPSRAQFEADALRSGLGPIYVAIRQNFPADYRAMMDRLYAFATARGVTQASFQNETSREHMVFLRSLMPDLRRAPLADLMRPMAERLALLEAVQHMDPALCGRMAAASNTGMPVPPQLQAGTKRVIVAMIEAAGAGRRTPAPPLRDMTAADEAAYRDAFARFDPQGDLRPLSSGEESVAAAAPERLCRLAIALQRTVLALPSDVGREAAIRMTELALNLPRG